jgi:hypothetical protein
LPDDVETAHRQIDRVALEDFVCQVHQHAVAQFAGVKEPDVRERDVPRAAEIFKHALASQAAHGVLPDRLRRIRFTRAATCPGCKSINGPGRKRNDPTRPIFLAHDTGQVGVHRPGARRIFRGTEFQSGQINDVGGLRQLRHRGFVQQIAAECFDAVGLQLGLFLRIGKTRNTDDATADPGQIGSAPGHAREGRSDFPGDPEQDDVTAQAAHDFHERWSRVAQQLLECFDRLNRIRHCMYQTVSRRTFAPFQST